MSKDLNIKNTFDFSSWYSKNPFDLNYKKIPNSSGVYILVKVDSNHVGRKRKTEIIYIGSSKDLKSRLSKHEVLRIAKSLYEYVKIYFIETPEYLEKERELIYTIKPKFNTNFING